MHILIGLGNPGSKYIKTRHNFGFLALDKIILEYNFVKDSDKFHSEVFKGEINGEKIIALKPQTFMNLSGIAALEAMQFYKINPANIIVFHDEIDLPLEKIRIKIGGGSAGHNGLKSLDETIGKEYWRVRLGVGRPENKEFEIADYVLSKFNEDEEKKVNVIVEKIVHEAPKLLDSKIDKTQILF